MARILIGNIKGPKGDTGAQGPQGPVGPQGPQGPLPPLVNNALATEAGVSALDAAMGKTLQEQITNNKNDITELNSDIVRRNLYDFFDRPQGRSFWRGGYAQSEGAEGDKEEKQGKIVRFSWLYWDFTTMFQDPFATMWIR